MVEELLRSKGGPGDVPDAELVLLHLEEHGGAVGVAEGQLLDESGHLKLNGVEVREAYGSKCHGSKVTLSMS